jgi:hypothetical protein
MSPERKGIKGVNGLVGFLFFLLGLIPKLARYVFLSLREKRV